MSERIRIRNVYPFSDADKAMLAGLDPRLEWIHDGEDAPAWAADVGGLAGREPNPPVPFSQRLELGDETFDLVV